MQASYAVPHRRTLLSAIALLAMLVATVVNGVRAVQAVSPNVVISQVYGGGGNAGATLKNDFIELFNRSNAPVTVDGWSVQYGSSGGTTWTATPLAGTIPAGGYYLVRQAAGAGGTVDLPTPDAAGNIAMSGTAAKVALVNTSTLLSGACPSGGSLVDL